MPPAGGSAPVEGRAGTTGACNELAGGFSAAVGVRSEPDAAGSGAVPGREGASPVESRSMAVGGRTELVGVCPGAWGARVTPAGGRMAPVAGRDPAAGRGVVGGRSDEVGGREEPPAGGELRVSRIEPVAGRFDGWPGAREGAVGEGEAGWPGVGSEPERGESVTLGAVEEGEAGR